jgi:hypothetical protein
MDTKLHEFVEPRLPQGFEGIVPVGSTLDATEAYLRRPLPFVSIRVHWWFN